MRNAAAPPDAPADCTLACSRSSHASTFWLFWSVGDVAIRYDAIDIGVARYGLWICRPIGGA